MNDRKFFDLTPDLVALLRASNVSRHLSEVEYGAAEIDGKRPYGDSDVPESIARVLGWDVPDEENEAARHLLDVRAHRLHKKTPTALEVVLSSGSFEPGLYSSPLYGSRWERVTDQQGSN